MMLERQQAAFHQGSALFHSWKDKNYSHNNINYVNLQMNMTFKVRKNIACEVKTVPKY